MKIFELFKRAITFSNKKVLRTDELDDEMMQAIMDAEVPDNIEYIEEEEEDNQ